MDTSYLTSQVATIINQLHGLFDEIGVPGHERDSRESELFNALSDTLHNQLRQVAAEKNELTEEGHRIIKAIKQMEASLDDSKGNDSYEGEDEDLKVSTPLLRCLQGLREKHNSISKVHKERFEQVKKLVQALESYSSHLEASFIQIALPPSSSSASVPLTFNLSPSYVNALDNEFTRVYEEYTRRVLVVKATAEEIIKLWAELGTPQVQTDGMIVKNYRDSPEQLGLHEEDLSRLKAKRDKLVEEKRGRERRLKELKVTVEGLWDRLGVEEAERKRFLAGNRGYGLRAINEFEDELGRLNELKRQNLHLFVEDARYKLQELWDGLYFSEEEMLEFTPAFSDVYSDALLSAHEAEISRLEALQEERAPTLRLIDKHRSLIRDRDDLAASSQDASRLMSKGQKGEKRDPTRLLREEKMRKRIAKELPKVTVDLTKTLEKWEDDYGRPFLVHGERYLDELAAAAARAPPPRSKTPSGPPPTAIKTQKPAPASRPGSVMSASVRGPPTTGGTLKRNAFAASMSGAGSKSPSKIPARTPLTNMPHGNNSPERRAQEELRFKPSGTVKMGPPSRAPPPKMRDLFAPPPPGPDITPMNAYTHRDTNYRTVSADSTTGSVRHVTPEDVYDDRERMSYMHPPSYPEHRAAALSNQHQSHHTYPSISSNSSVAAQDQRYPQHSHAQGHHQGAGSRQISNSSSAAATTISGSENWETYDDASEPEQDATEAYYAKLRAARGKRFTPEGGHALSPQNKKIKGIRGVAGVSHNVVEQGGRMVAVSGSDAGSAWTDEDVF
ncbi:MAG: hypothetical protein M1829_005935 [Trizodia sp. TS-e1964]|nr:MAG: hypothetical protein M1829_005935 [Trizodia sp. TS-e1964]